MTTIGQKSETCCLCGSTNEFSVVMSTSIFGSPDLDTRPPDLARDSVYYAIHRCLSCGYCAPNVSVAEDAWRAVVKSPDYQSQLSDRRHPVPANALLCWSMLQDTIGAVDQAGWAALQAAWVCDDENAAGASVDCRHRAATLFCAAREQQVLFAEQAGAEEAILADVFRRAREHARVECVCQEGLARQPEEVIRQILKYEIALAEQQDDTCHTIEEALAHE